MSEIKEKLESEMKVAKALCETMEHAIKTQIDKGLDKVDTHELYEAVDIYKDLGEVKKNIAETCYYKQLMEAMEKSEYGEDYDEDGPIERRFYRGQPRSKTSGRYMSRNDGRRSYPYMYIPDTEWDRDMDRYTGNRMYYSGSGNMSGGNSNSSGNTGSSSNGNTGNNSRGYSEGYSDGNQRGYEDGNRRGYDEGYKRGYDEGNRRGYSESRNSSSGMNSNSRYDMAKRGYEESKAMHTGNTAEDNNANVRKIEEMMDIISEDMKQLLPKMTPSEKTALKSRMQTLTTHIS